MMSQSGKFGPLVGAIDEGTSSARFIIFKANSSEVVAIHQKELEQQFPQEGWVEQDPYAILEVVTTCIDKAVEKLIEKGGSPKDIIAVGVTNQRETTIVWDRCTGKPLHNAIVWLDMRTSSTIDKLLDTVPNKTRNKNYLKPLCGLPLSPYFSAVKLRWLCDNIDAVKNAMKNNSCCFGTVDTWIIWNLTGGANGGKHVTDVTNASRTMLMNIETLTWDPLLLKFFEVPKSVLPEIKSSSEVYGVIANGPLEGVPVSGCLGDQQAALVGQMCLQKGQAKATYGTGCFVLYNTGDVRVSSSRGLLTTVAYQLGSEEPPVYALEGSVAVAGAALGWLKDNIGLLESAKDSQALAEKATENGSVVFVPAFSGLYAPYWRQDARGVICGITEDTNSNHIIKASLEAVCYQVRDILDAMNEDCGIPLQLLKVDGGMTSNALVMQMQADLIGINVIRAGFTESTALGAALAAYWGVADEQVTAIPMLNGIEYTPNITEDERDMRYKQWKMAVERSLVVDQLVALHSMRCCLYPYKTHHGGLWEAGVKSIKYHLKRILTTHLTYEEMTTVLCEIEACLNSRPLYPVDDSDPDNITPITPGHFLIGEAPINVLSPNMKEAKLSTLSRWQHTQKLVNDFWRRWQTEYLSRLQQRPK